MGKLQCVLHGSFNKHFKEIQNAYKIFTDAGVEVIAPKAIELVGSKDGFVLFEGETNKDPRFIELEYLHKIKQIGNQGFSYFVNQNGYIGKTTSYELAVAQLINVPCFYSSLPKDHPVYISKSLVISPEDLVEYINKNHQLPSPKIPINEAKLHSMWQDLIAPGSVVATGAIIEKEVKDKVEVLLVKTHKWGGRYSMVGGKVRRNERLEDALLREVFEETQLKGDVGKHIVTFDQIKNSGYFKTGVEHIFVDNIVQVKSKKVTLNEEAQDYIWAEPREALQHLDIEPNAKHTLKLYVEKFAI